MKKFQQECLSEMERLRGALTECIDRAKKALALAEAEAPESIPGARLADLWDEVGMARACLPERSGEVTSIVTLKGGDQIKIRWVPEQFYRLPGYLKEKYGLDSAGVEIDPEW